MDSNEHFEELAREHYEPLFRFAMTLAKNEADASDLTQQAFYLWAAKGHQLRDLAKVKTWLFTSLYRAFLLGKRSANRYVTEEFEIATADIPCGLDDAPRCADGSQALVALSQVDVLFRAPLALFYLEEISYVEIAELLQVPIGTVKSRIARGIAQLREIFLASDSNAMTQPVAQVRRDLSISRTWEQFAFV